MPLPQGIFRSICRALVLNWLVVGQDVGTISAEAGETKQKVNPTKHVLWPKSRPLPSQSEYASWYKSSELAWVSEEKLPHVASESKVELVYLTKPVFSLIGRAASIWHAGLGFRVENGPSFVFEYTSVDFMAAVAYPDRNGSTGSDQLLHWPSLGIVDYLTDPSGKTFPEAGASWKESYSIGTTTGALFNSFADWAFGYALNHSRYLVWRVLEPDTEKTLLDSAECFDFVFEGIRMLQAQRGTDITVAELPRTIVNVYASKVETLAFNSTVGIFFASQRRVLEEWVELTDKLPIHLGAHSKEWYWPAWFSLTPYAGGNGKLLQDTDYPQTYHRYILEWPKAFKSKTKTLGLFRISAPIHETTELVML